MIYKLVHTLIAKFVNLFIFWIPEVVLRKKFELKNLQDPGSQSFKAMSLKADLCFEFSSEGEFAQVSSLVEDALILGKRVELVMFSPSVEKQVLKIYQRFPLQVRYLRYPILTYRFWSSDCFSNWVTSSVLYLVRYDFFPEFLCWSKMKGHTLKLLWLSFKKDRLKNRPISFLKRKFLQASSLNVFATIEDLNFVKELKVDGLVYDFRMEQIYRRKLHKEKKFAVELPHYLQMMEHLKKWSSPLIFGNCWVADLHLLDELSDDVSVLLVPHQLDAKNLMDLQLELDKKGLEYQVIDEHTQAFTAPVLIMNKKGVLCELYEGFSYAYVGGGFGVSIHSILEPLVNGVPFISCGPVNHRSTEIDVAKSYGVLTEVHNSMEFMKWLGLEDGQGMIFESSSYEKKRKEVIGC